MQKKTGEIDFFYTSGTLQCVDEPFVFLEKMLSVKADFMLFNRNGFTPGERDLTVIHRAKLSWNGIAGQLPEGINDRWTEYPFTFVQKSKFEERVQKDYDFISTFEEKSGIFPVNDEPLVGLGVFCKRKTN